MAESLNTVLARAGLSVKPDYTLSDHPQLDCMVIAATVLSSASIAESFDEHPLKRQQQAADAKAPERRKRREARSPALKGVTLLKARKAVQGKVGYGTIYTAVTGFAGRTAPFSFCAIFYFIWRLHAA